MTLSPPESRVHDVVRCLCGFADTTSGVEHAIIVSGDGLLLARSTRLGRAQAEALATIVSGLRALSDGGARLLGRGGASQVIVEMFDGYLFAGSIGSGASIGVLTTRTAELGTVGYAMTVFAQQIGSRLTPDLVTELGSQPDR